MFQLECCDDDALARILPQLEAEQIDSDQDGTSDVEELRAGTDPNDATAGAEIACQPQHDGGCSVASGRAKHARSSGIAPTSLLVACGVLALLSARRRVQARARAR